VLDRNQAATRLLALRALWRSAASLSLPQACAAVNTAFALAAQSWTSRGFGAEEEATPALRLMAGLYLDQHLASPALKPEAVAADLGLSRSTLYRLFAGEGGVRRQILMRRLDRCFTALLEPRMQATAIGDIAFMQGFNSEAHFSRAFRQRFGIAARDLRFMARQRAAARTRQSDEAPTTMRDWLRELGAAESAGS
jgi:AraC-like DNA-binding protein